MHQWHGQRTPEDGIDPKKSDVSKLTAPIGYGGSGNDPPQLVWMDHCESAGSTIDSGDLSNGTPYEDNSDPILVAFKHYRGANRNHYWANVFGVYPDESEGVFLGWSGYGFQYDGAVNPAYAWNDWRDKFWIKLADGANIGTALNSVEATMGAPLFYGQDGKGNRMFADPRYRARVWGTLSTAF